MTGAGPRGPGRGEGGGCAAAHFPDAAALTAGGRAAEGYGAAPPASRVLRIALRATALRAAPDPGDRCGPSARQYGQAPACPARGAARPCPGGGRSPGTGKEPRPAPVGKSNGTDVRIVRTKAKITRNRYEEVSTVLGEPRRPLGAAADPAQPDPAHPRPVPPAMDPRAITK